MDNPTSDHEPWDVVDEASFESFPASDPPGYGSWHATASSAVVAAAQVSAGSLDGLEPADGFLAEDTPARGHVLIAFSSSHHRYIRSIAETIRAHIEALGFVAELADAATHGMPAVPDYDAVVVGTTLGRLRDREIVRWLDRFRDELGDVAAALFIAGPDHRLARAVERVSRVLHWRPVMVESFPVPGALQRWLVGEPSFEAQAAKLSARVAEAIGQRRPSWSTNRG